MGEAGLVPTAQVHERDLLLHTFRSSLAGRYAAHADSADRSAAQRLTDELEGALPVDDDRRRHWMVTVALCSQAAGDDELSTVQRDAYRDFRARVGSIVEQSHADRAADAEMLAEQLIAAADGIAIQALFDPDSWPASRQLARLHDTIGLLLGGATPSSTARAATSAPPAAVR